MDKRAVGQRIRVRMKEMGLTARELADRLGCHESHLSRVMRGMAGEMSYDTVRDWARTLGVTPQWLVDGDDPDVTDAFQRLSADPDLGRALIIFASWFEAARERDRETFRHLMRLWSEQLNKRGARPKLFKPEDVVETENDEKTGVGYGGGREPEPSWSASFR